MASRRPVVHWDSCIFFAWLNNEAEAHGVAVLDGIAEMVADIDSGKIALLTAVQTKTDVYDHKLKTQWGRDEFTKMLQRPNVMLVIQDERVADKAREIREHYARKGILLGATDCTQLASAILWGADVFYTLDGAGVNPKRNDLLPLNGDVAGHRLTIQKPHSKQGSLFSGIPRTAVSSAVSPRDRLKVVARNTNIKAPKKSR